MNSVSYLARLPFLEVVGGAESANPLITGLVLLAPAPCPQAVQGPTKSHLININSCLVDRGSLGITENVSHLCHSRNTKIRSSVPGIRDKDQVSTSYYLTISHQGMVIYSVKPSVCRALHHLAVSSALRLSVICYLSEESHC